MSVDNEEELAAALDAEFDDAWGDEEEDENAEKDGAYPQDSVELPPCSQADGLVVDNEDSVGPMAHDDEDEIGSDFVMPGCGPGAALNEASEEELDLDAFVMPGCQPDAGPPGGSIGVELADEMAGEIADEIAEEIAEVQEEVQLQLAGADEDKGVWEPEPISKRQRTYDTDTPPVRDVDYLVEDDQAMLIDGLTPGLPHSSLTPELPPALAPGPLEDIGKEEACKHPSFWAGMCVVCGAPKPEDERSSGGGFGAQGPSGADANQAAQTALSTTSLKHLCKANFEIEACHNSSTKSAAHTAPSTMSIKHLSKANLEIGHEEAERLKLLDEAHLLAAKKLVLVLDLDHTLLNSVRLMDP
eukprot:gene4944-34716_t